MRHAVFRRGRSADNSATRSTDSGTGENRSCTGTGGGTDNGAGRGAKATADKRAVSLAA